MAATTTLGDTRPTAQVCRDLGWGVGTRLVGDEGYGPTTIEITAIGEVHILAKVVASPDSCLLEEGEWVLWCRDWQPVDLLEGATTDA